VVFGWYILVKEGARVTVQQCPDEQTAKATVIALFSENREVIEGVGCEGLLSRSSKERNSASNGCCREEHASVPLTSR
jgi:hypothetical protein